MVPIALLLAVSLSTLALICEFVMGAMQNAELAIRNVAAYLAFALSVAKKMMYPAITSGALIITKICLRSSL